jgi:tRNA G18 (ribose-2'-O)-methylase SpoU
MEIIVAIENVRSLYNVGSIIRTSEFFGFKKVALLGFTAHDPYSPDEINSKLKKTALSSFDKVKLEKFKDIDELTEKYPNFELICIENNVPKTFPLKDWIPNQNTIIVFGNEPAGINEKTLLKADKCIEIPRIGTHPSLNVATAAGIVLYHTIGNI